MVRQVLVGFDGSAGATAAVTWGVREAQLHGARLVAFAALDPLPTAPARQPVTVGDDAALLASLAAAVRKATAEYPAVFRYGKELPRRNWSPPVRARTFWWSDPGAVARSPVCCWGRSAAPV